MSRVFFTCEWCPQIRLMCSTYPSSWSHFNESDNYFCERVNQQNKDEFVSEKRSRTTQATNVKKFSVFSCNCTDTLLKLAKICQVNYFKYFNKPYISCNNRTYSLITSFFFELQISYQSKKGYKNNLNILQLQLKTFCSKSNNFMFYHDLDPRGSLRKKGEYIKVTTAEIEAMVLHQCRKLHVTFLSLKSVNKLFSALTSHSSFSSKYKRLRLGN